jgi:lysozyme family protein
VTTFDSCFAIVVSTEGGLSLNPADPGNWTGPGRTGTLRGTKWGISAASYPTLDIAALTIDAAKEIYRRDYYDKIAGDHLPPPLALIVFDAAVNSGVSRAARWLQTALGVHADGVIGPATLAAIEAQAGRGADLCAEVMARRMVFDASLPTFPTFGLGWCRRLARLPYQSLTVGA